MRRLLALLPLLLLARTAHAEIAIGESLDWLAIEHPDIAVMRAVKVDRPDDRTAVATLARVEALKGAPPAQLRDDRAFEVEKGDRVLVFLDGKSLAHAIDLDHPSKIGDDGSFTTDFELVTDGDRILEIVRSRIRRHEPAPSADARHASVFSAETGFLRLEVPVDSTAFTALYGGSTCYLIVPADADRRDALEKEIRDSSDAWTAARAAMHLAAYPDDRSKTLLRSLLTDPRHERLDSTDGTRHHVREVYPLRQAAWEALAAMNVETPKPEGFDPTLDRSYFR